MRVCRVSLQEFVVQNGFRVLTLNGHNFIKTQGLSRIVACLVMNSHE